MYNFLGKELKLLFIIGLGLLIYSVVGCKILSDVGVGVVVIKIIRKERVINLVLYMVRNIVNVFLNNEKWIDFELE